MNDLKRYWLVYAIVILCFAAASFLSSGFVTAVTASEDSLRSETTIVIDPGHGGEDGGAVSCTGVLESQINLEISKRLNDLLHLTGYETFMLRDRDTALYSADATTYSGKKVSDLKNRVATINAIDDAVLVSIHQNNFSQSKYSGAQVFYGQAENSKEFGTIAQNILRQSLNPANNRKEKSAKGVYLMEHITCPGILIECGFLSNAPEEAKLRTPAYQKQIAQAVAGSIGAFLTQDEEI